MDSTVQAWGRWSGVMNHVYYYAPNGRYTVDLMGDDKWEATYCSTPGAEVVIIGRETGNGAIDRLKVSCEFHSSIYA